MHDKLDYNRTEDITPEEVRQLDEYKNASDQEVKNVVDTKKKLADIAFNIYAKRYQNKPKSDE